MKSILHMIVMSTSLAAGLSFAESRTKNQATASIPQSSVPNLIKIPRILQSTNYTCGVAASLAILAYFGYDMTESELAVYLKPDPKVGTPPRRIVAYFKSEGFDVFDRQDMTLADLTQEIDNGRPTLVVMQAWASGEKVDWKNSWDSGHYVVAIGYDAKNIYFMDPYTIGQFTFIPRQEFLLRWHDQETPTKRYIQWGMSVGKKGFKPAFIQDEIKYLP